MHTLRRMARVMSVALIASSGIFAIGLLLTSATNGTGDLFLPFAGAFAGIGVLLTIAQPEVHRFLIGLVRRHAEAIYVGSIAVGLSVSLFHYALAVVALQYGPDARGYEFLMTASTVAPLTALVAAAAQVALAAKGAPRIRERIVALGLLAVTTAVPVTAMVLLGRTLATTQPLAQPEAVSSLVLAMWGVGQQLVVVPVAFAAAAALVPLVAWVRARVLRARAPRRRVARIGGAATAR